MPAPPRVNDRSCSSRAQAHRRSPFPDAPVEGRRRKMADGLYREVHSPKGLTQAWLLVRANGRASRSSETREEVRRFDERSAVYLRRIADQLRARRFRFQPGRGVLIPREGKTPRPLVVGSIGDRIVQRRILDILQRQYALVPYLLSPPSFGGVVGKGVPKAIAATVKAIS